MLFMVIERFKDRDPTPIYTRVRDEGRALPEGLRYLDSWVEANFDRCFQLMECDDALVLQQWVLQWRDLCEGRPRVVLIRGKCAGTLRSVHYPLAALICRYHSSVRPSPSSKATAGS
jgi:hypothetical protein